MGVQQDIDYRWRRLDAEHEKQEKALEAIDQNIGEKFLKIKKALMDLNRDLEVRTRQFETAGRQKEKIVQELAELYKKLYAKQIEEQEQEIAELKARLEELEINKEPEVEDPSLVKAKTVAIFDSILFAIENWSTDGDTAPDFSLACQSILFPLVYSQVMNGNEHYFLKTVPTASIEVVKRGREYVKFIRGTCQVGLTDPEAWSVHVPMIAKWWVNDALPLLYGARDDVWERITPLTLEAIMSWRDKPASRALEFPLVFDAMDLLDRHREEIREKTNLPEFTRETLNTRLEAN